MIVLKNGSVFTSTFAFAKTDLLVENEKIADVTNEYEYSALDDSIDCTDMYVIPGYIDLHTHGCAGYDNMDLSQEAMEKISEHMAHYGTTTYLPTIMTAAHETLVSCAKNIAAFAESGKSTANIGGIYSEGPYFSPKYKGAQDPKFVKDPDCREFEELYKASKGLLKIVSLAPEREGTLEFIDKFSAKVRIAIGHTDADYETAKAAIAHGASQLTHTFNAMRPLHHREPNAIGAALDSDIFLELISDGFHIDPAVVRILFKTAADRVVLISDSLRPTGMSDGIYMSGGQEVKMESGNLFLNDGSGTIAGSSVHVCDCVKRAVSFGIPLEDVLRAATYNPAKAAGMENECGSLRKGLRADVLITDKDLEIKHIMIRGKMIM